MVPGANWDTWEWDLREGDAGQRQRSWCSLFLSVARSKRAPNEPNPISEATNFSNSPSSKFHHSSQGLAGFGREATSQA